MDTSRENVGDVFDCKGKNVCLDKYLSTTSPEAFIGSAVDATKATRHFAYALNPNVHRTRASAMCHSHNRITPHASLSSSSELHNNDAPSSVFANALVASHAPRLASASASPVNRFSALTAPGARAISYTPLTLVARSRKTSQNLRRCAALAARLLASACAT